MEAGRFEVRDVADLPWPHDPFKCPFRSRFGEAARAVDTFEERQAAIAAVAHSLTPAELAECDYHATDWVTAADVAVAIVEGRGVRRRDQTARRHKRRSGRRVELAQQGAGMD